MRSRTFTFCAFAAFLFLSLPSFAQNYASMKVEPKQEAESPDIGARKREYHQKVMKRMEARAQAKEAKAAAREAKYQEEEALEAAIEAERLIKLEARAQRRQEKKSNNQGKAPDTAAK